MLSCIQHKKIQERQQNQFFDALDMQKLKKKMGENTNQNKYKKEGGKKKDGLELQASREVE